MKVRYRKAFPHRFKLACVASMRAGISAKKISEDFSVSTNNLHRWARQYKHLGKAAPFAIYQDPPPPPPASLLNAIGGILPPNGLLVNPAPKPARPTEAEVGAAFARAFRASMDLVKLLSC